MSKEYTRLERLANKKNKELERIRKKEAEVEAQLIAAKIKMQAERYQERHG